MKRGDIYLATLNPVKGSEQAGTRPVLLFQDNNLIRVKWTVIVIPFSTNLRLQKLPSCVLVLRDEGGLRQDSVAMCHQMRTLDKQRLLNYWGTLPDARVKEIERAVLRTLGIALNP